MKYTAIIIAATGLILAGCSGEKTSEPKVDASVHVDTGDAKDKVNSALDKAGDDLKKAGNEAKAKMQDAGDALKAKANEVKDKVEDKKPSVDVNVNTK